MIFRGHIREWRTQEKTTCRNLEKHITAQSHSQDLLTQNRSIWTYKLAETFK